LIRLSLFAFGLQIDNLGNAIPSEHVMITPHPYSKTKAAKQLAQFGKLSIRVGTASQNFLSEFQILYQLVVLIRLVWHF
jgi:hypothetical protein